jgi:hypothetical protein
VPVGPFCSWAVSWWDHFALVSPVFRVHVQNVRCEYNVINSKK